MKNIEVVKSSIHGKGIITREPIKKGEYVGTIKGDIKYKINKTLKDTFSHPDWVGFKKNHWTDPVAPFKYINHSCNANCGLKGTRKVYAVRDIKANEELTLDYSITEIDLNWKMECSCQSKNCRKVIRSIQNLPQKTFNIYYPFVPTHFKKMYLNSKT